MVVHLMYGGAEGGELDISCQDLHVKWLQILAGPID
jgi:hypothetical protein